MATPGDVMADVWSMANEKTFWPDFHPLRIPVAIYDGERTWLFCHPAPPPGFSPLPGDSATVVCDGLLSDIRANTAILIGGVWTACLLRFSEDAEVRDAASIVIHEMFHAFQGMRHPDWWANEGDRYAYPVFDAEALALRRLETRLVRCALEARGEDGAARCARRALDLRRARYERMDAFAVAYERGIERIEGLAHYVEGLARGRAGIQLPNERYAPDEVRGRCYHVGAAWARLLDRLCDGWAAEFERSTEVPVLDRALSAALDRIVGLEPAPLDEMAAESERAAATRDAAALTDRYRRLRADFLTLAGWRIVVDSGLDNRLRMVGFDPSNLSLVAPTEMLHTRYLSVTDCQGAGMLEVLDGRALTTTAEGGSPLHDDILRLEVAGLGGEALPGDGGGLPCQAGRRLRSNPRTP